MTDPQGRISTPDLLGMSVHDARRAARLAGLQVVAEERPSPQGLWGRVLEQDPPPGTATEAEAAVTLVIGGRPHVVVPDVSGRDEQEALALLQDAGLTAERRASRRSGKVPEGHVLRTRPRAGSEVPVGSRVAYVIASGPKLKGGHGKGSRQQLRAGRLPDGSFITLPDD